MEYCKDFLDKAGVQPCGHSARKKRIKLKVFCSCQPDQIGSSLFYSVRGNGNDKNTGMAFVGPNKEIAPEQTTCGRDFTEIQTKRVHYLRDLTFKIRGMSTEYSLSEEKTKGDQHGTIYY